MEAQAILEKLKGAFGDRITAADLEGLEPWAAVAPESLPEVALYCRDDEELRFDNLMCLSAVDFPKQEPPRIDVVYHLLSYPHGHKFVLKAQLERERPAVPSVEEVWGVANWHEREAYDMLGVVFTGHSDLRRILLPDDWQGHPLRKDWEDPEFYNGMRVRPTEQMAKRAEAGEKIGVGPFEFTPPNRHAKA
jgi:NADH-quinone oxidoreductase subunit C